ncbi:MAG: hypothetical protein GY855_02080, partial [candidate division Zixibacteria bacterium]|nr:hypothetical protein [candidate division Zixibacteria bacterium]
MIKWKNIGLIIPLISILMLIGNVFAAGEMYYYDKAFNRDWDLTPKTDEICIKFTERLDDSDVADFTRDYGLTEIHNAMWNRYIVYRLKSGFDTYVIDQLKTDQRVVDAAVPGIDK